MLVLSRKLNETIVIEGNIRVTVVGTRGNQVRLGVQAPERVGVYREELCLPVRAVGACGGPPTPAAPLRQAVRPDRRPENDPRWGRQDR